VEEVRTSRPAEQMRVDAAGKVTVENRRGVDDDVILACLREAVVMFEANRDEAVA
jgi:hypothetical protein